MSTQQDINAIRIQRLANTHDLLALMASTKKPLHPDQSSLITYLQHPQPNNNFVPQPSFNANYMQQPMQNPKNISDLTTTIDMELVLMAKAFTLKDTTLINNNQRSSSNPSNIQIAQPGMSMDQHRQMLMVENNVGNQLSVDPGIANQYGIRNVVIAQAEANGNGINGNQIRCYNCQGMQIAQKEETRIQLTFEEFDFMAAISACEETKRENANFTLENNFQHASTSSTQSDKAPVYDSDGSTEVHLSENCCDNDIFNMFTQEEQYIKLLKPFPEPHQVQQNDSNVIYAISSMKQEAAKFVRDFKSLAKEADEFIVKHKALKLEIERLLRAVVSHDIMSVVQNNSVVDTLNLQTELERTKERFESCIIKKENEYAKLWNDWYKKYEECKYDKILYDKAYNDMQQKIEWLQAQLGVLKGKISDTQWASDTLDPLPQKLENENLELEVNNTGTTRRPHPRRNSNTDRVPSKSKSNCLLNNVKKIKENHRNSQIPKNQNHMSSECNNITLAIRNAKSEIVTPNHDVCVLNYVNHMNSYADNQSANVSKPENQKKHKANAKKLKELGSKVSLASFRPSKPRTCLS
uniref:Integrase, catalytic region, zinc finger, CCHC-type, peptidase aspartic, catalytic n=1 Tax=Tanacetum cinerariifolium TaxID=118510 RepID=A0A699GVN1_TANCI|nr:hypothetical protein [Tanacetum cinerariifolium]